MKIQTGHFGHRHVQVFLTNHEIERFNRLASNGVLAANGFGDDTSPAVTLGILIANSLVQMELHSGNKMEPSVPASPASRQPLTTEQAKP